MKIDTRNFLGDRFSSVSDINRSINIDYIDRYRLYRLLVFIDWARRVLLYTTLTPTMTSTPLLVKTNML